MKIAIIGSRGIPARYGGYESFVENLGIRLKKMGWDITVFCPSTNPYKKYLYRGVKLRFVLNLERYLGALGMLLYDLLSLLRVTFMDFPVIFVLGYSSSFFCIIPKVFGKKIVINTNGLEWKRSKWSKLARVYLKLSEWFAVKIANVLVSDSLAIKKYYIEKYGRDSIFIPNGAEIYSSKQPKIFKKFRLKKFGYYLLVARLEPENNIHTIIKGFSLTNSEKKLFIVANRKKTRYFQKIMKLCKKDKRIIFFGPLYDKDKLNEIRTNAFAYIHGHSVGGTNPSLLESMGCGSVVIVFNVPFNREVARNGFFFKDEVDLKRIIEILERMELKKLKNIRRENREIIQQYYNWNKITREYFKLFVKLVDYERPA